MQEKLEDEQKENKFDYLRLMKFLFKNEYKALSNDERILYSLLLEHHQESVKKGWVDEDNKIFILFKREEMMSVLGCSKTTIIKAMKTLNKFGLLEEKRQGLCKPNLIYLKIPL